MNACIPSRQSNSNETIWYCYYHYDDQMMMISTEKPRYTGLTQPKVIECMLKYYLQTEQASITEIR